MAAVAERLFRSTGSYEPDLDAPPREAKNLHSFDPQALTSLTSMQTPHSRKHRTFRSTGSYEPDRQSVMDI